MTGTHSRTLAPSAAHRWFRCPGSSALAARYRDEPGEAAMEGTAAHWLLEACLVEGTEPEKYLGRTIRVTEEKVTREFIVTREMAADVALGVRTVREVATIPGESRVEADVALPHVHEDLFGRTDIWHWGDDNVLTVADYKHGRVDVDPVDNEQLMIYALGIYRAHADFIYYNQGRRRLERVRLVIIQPRSIAPVPRVKTWEFPAEQLERFEATLRVMVDRVRGGTPIYEMGSWCKYCPALGACPASQDAAQTVGGLLFASEEIHPTQAGRLLSLKVLVDAQMKKAEAVVQDALMRGQEVAGHKLVTGRKHRQWRDEEQAKDALVEACGIGALVPPTPAQAEKMGPDAQRVVELLAFTPPGEPTVAPSSDKRAPFVARSAAEMFRASVEAIGAA